jgi:hypothetical protein
MELAPGDARRAHWHLASFEVVSNTAVAGFAARSPRGGNLPGPEMAIQSVMSPTSGSELDERAISYNYLN